MTIILVSIEISEAIALRDVSGTVSIRQPQPAAGSKGGYLIIMCKYIVPDLRRTEIDGIVAMTYFMQRSPVTGIHVTPERIPVRSCFCNQ